MVGLKLGAGCNSFPKSVRLITKADYAAVFNGSCRVSSSVLTVFAIANKCDNARLGLAISRKCAKRALDRNRIKRVIRETFRISKAELPALDFVITCYPNVLEVSNSTLRTFLLTQIKKVCQRICVG